MTEETGRAKKVEIDRFKVEVYLGATVSVNGNIGWVKPSMSTATTWNGLPDFEDIEVALRFMSEHVLNPGLDDFLASIKRRMVEEGLV